MSSEPAEATAQLISRVRAGDEVARNHLFARYLPILQQWARGRVPARARGMNDTDDLVQATLMRVLKRVETLTIEREGAFLAYLRTTLMNALRDELRLSVNKTHREEVPDSAAADEPSALDRAIDRETFDAYERALASLAADQQEAVMLRLEFQMSYAEIAEAVGIPSADAARMKVSRAVTRLAEALEEHRG